MYESVLLYFYIFLLSCFSILFIMIRMRERKSIRRTGNIKKLPLWMDVTVSAVIICFLFTVISSYFMTAYKEELQQPEHLEVTGVVRHVYVFENGTYEYEIITPGNTLYMTGNKEIEYTPGNVVTVSYVKYDDVEITNVTIIGIAEQYQKNQYCKVCGHERYEEDLFCRNCGECLLTD